MALPKELKYAANILNKKDWLLVKSCWQSEKVLFIVFRKHNRVSFTNIIWYKYNVSVNIEEE